MKPAQPVTKQFKMKVRCPVSKRAKSQSSILACLALLLCVSAPRARSQTIPLYSGSVPGALGDEPADRPELTAFPAPRETRVPTAVIVCPGGSYRGLAMAKEGTDVAAWYNKLGITAFVLKYRLGPRYHHPIELSDAQRAIRLVRAHASEYGAAPDRIGIMGFSAGGHLASTAATHFDAGQPQAADPVERQSSRPDFVVLAYPVITLLDPYAHVGSRTNLLGESPNPMLKTDLSNELQVTARTPPTFLFHTTQDETVPVENSVQFYLALRKAGVPAELHVYLQGKHGVGLAAGDPILHTWTDHLADWLKASGLR